MRRPGAIVVFSVVFVIAYTLCFYFNVALFKYYPMVREFHVASQGRAAGPPISWYGWLAVSALVALFGYGVALVVPARLTGRIPSSVAWIIPAIVLVAVLVYEKRWFV
jgi:hypothetical protein